MNGRTALKSYVKNELTSKVSEESPERLILMLLQKGCTLLMQADQALATESLEEFHDYTTHCMQIIVALRGLLDFENGGDVAARLAETYDSINLAIFKAKRIRSRSELAKLHLALSELREGWSAIV